MEKVIESKILESTGYRCLLEAVKQEGIVPVTKLIQDIRSLPSKEVLVLQTIAGVGNEINTLEENNKDIIKYLKEHVNELAVLNLTDENLYKTLINLINNESLISLYLENAKRLEELKVKNIKFVKDLKSFNANGDCYRCTYAPRDDCKGLKYIIKYYTDANVLPRLTEEEAHAYSRMCSTSNGVYFSLIGNATFVLKCINKDNFSQDRSIEIMDFGFDGSKLPTEEELQSYDIPKSLIKTNRNES